MEEGQAGLGKAKARIDEWVVDASKDDIKVAPAEETPNSGGAAGSAGPQEMQTENFDIATPMQGRSEAGSPEKQRMSMENADVELEDGIARWRDVRMNTPERAPPVKRRADEDGMPIDDESLKARWLTDDERMGMSSTQMEKDMSEEDRKILASMLLGVDITEVYSPERIARVATEFGLVAGSSMDLTNGWDFARSDH